MDLRFDVTQPADVRFSLRAFVQDAMRPRFGGGFRPYSSGRGPSVVAYNSRGDECVIKVTTSIDEARELAQAIEQDYRRLSPSDWCETYNVPTSFVSDSPEGPRDRLPH